MDASHCSHAKQRQGNVQKKCAVTRPIVVFHSSCQRHPTTVFCKISVRRSKFCLGFSFTWLGISR